MAVLPRGCGGGAGRCRARQAVRPRVRRAWRQQMSRGGGGVCVVIAPPPSTGGAWDSAGWTGTALGHPMRPLRLRVCGGRHCVYHLEPPRASTSRCGHRPCRASRHPAHLRTAPPCCPPALVMQTWSSLEHRGHQGCGPRRRRVRRAVLPRVRRARRQQMPKGGRRAAGLCIFFRARTVSHTPCSRLLCQQGPWRRRQQRAQHCLDVRSLRSKELCEWRWRRRRRAVCAAARFNTAGGA